MIEKYYKILSANSFKLRIAIAHGCPIVKGAGLKSRSRLYKLVFLSILTKTRSIGEGKDKIIEQNLYA